MFLKLRKEHIPNLLTTFRAVAAPLTICLELLKFDGLQFGFITSLIFTDHLDGYLARKYKTASETGKHLEDVADFTFNLSITIAINLHLDLIPWPTFIAAAVVLIALTLLTKFLAEKAYKAVRIICATLYGVVYTLVLFVYSIEVGSVAFIIAILFTLFSIIWKFGRAKYYFKKFLRLDF